MSNDDRKERLLRRRASIIHLVGSLDEEVCEIDEELERLAGKSTIRLNKKFLQEVFLPLMQTEKRGLAVNEIKERLEKLGISVGDNQLRIFLTRTGQRNVIERVHFTRGRGKWRLKENQAAP